MSQSYREIRSELARRVRLVVTDVDGTLTAADDSLSSAALEAVHRLEEQGIAVGLASGRTLPRVESIARDLGISGLLIAENGGVAKINVGGGLVDLGYSNHSAMRALEKLTKLFPKAVEETEDNKYRLVDVGIRVKGIKTAELRGHLAGTDTELLDSGYMLHLLPQGISKGETLMRLLEKIGNEGLSREEVAVFGDSTTDMSLFRFFPHSVLITNPRLPAHETQSLTEIASYVSGLSFGEGFAQVVSHILAVRQG
ncbi:HMP-PP phosphatase [subsurface metagenome]